MRKQLCWPLGITSMVLAALAIGAWSQPSEALVGDGRGRDIYYVDISTGDRILMSGNRWDRPAHLLTDANGNALVIDTMAGIVDRVSPMGIDTVAEPPSASAVWNASAAVMLDATHLLVIGNPNGTLAKIDLVTGEQTVLSSSAVGDGPPQRIISALAVQDPAHALVTLATQVRTLTEAWGDGLYSIDLSTGNWTPLVLAPPVSDETELVDLVDPREIFPGAGGQAVLLESNPPALSTVTAGESTIFNVSLITEGEGEALVYPVSAVRRDSQNLWVLDRALEGIYSVNTVTGIRTLLSREGERGDGPSLSAPADMTIAPGGNALWAMSGLDSQQIISVDLNTGNRSVIFEATVGDGPLFEVGPQDIIPWGPDNVLALANGGRDLVLVGLVTGNRIPLSSLQLPVNHIALASDGKIWGVRDISLLRIDPETGSEEVVATTTAGQYSQSFLDVVQYDWRHVFVSARDFGSHYSLQEIDPEWPSAELLPLFDDPLYGSHSFYHIAAVDVDNFVVVESMDNQSGFTQSNSVYRYHRGDTELLPVSTSDFGGGAPLTEPRQLLIDETDDIWIVNAFDPPSLLRVALLSGSRTEISGANRGAGPMWQTATGLLLPAEPLPPIQLNRLLALLLGKENIDSETIKPFDLDNSGRLDAADLVLTIGP